MNRSATLLVLVICCRVCPSLAADCHVSPTPIPWPKDLPVYDHVVIVVEENKGFSQIIEAPAAPYINSLRADGSSLTQMFAEEHHSQGNYFWLLSGSNQNVGFRDRIPANRFTTSNLAQQLGDGAFKGYAEDLPKIGSREEFARRNAKNQHLYARKHVPWISFSNIPNSETIDKSANLRFADFPQNEEGFSHLPRVSFVIPNQDHDMHNGKAPGSIHDGDDWLQQNLDRYYQWARQHNSLLIITFDENDHESFFGGLTDPAAKESEDRNQIATIFAGAHVKRGYSETRGATHVNVLRTLEAMYDLPRSGAQQEKACAAGIYDDFILSDLWDKIALPGEAAPD